MASSVSRPFLRDSGSGPSSDALASSSSSASYATQLTPEGGSDSDFDPLGQDYTSIELQHRDPEKRSPAERLDVDEEDEEEGDDDDDDDEKDERPVFARRGSASTTHSFQLYTPDEERAVVRKFDRRLVLFVALLYMLSFLDRSSMCSPPSVGLVLL